MKKIAITGGIASGKTTVCRLLKEHGAYILYSDEIIHELLLKEPICIGQVVELLGPEIVDNGIINRTKVAEIVFNDPEKLEALENILHPKLCARIEKEYRSANEKGLYQFFVVEIPLVQEINKEKDFDFVIAVVANEEKVQQRLIHKGLQQEMFDKRMKRHWTNDKKKNQANYAIENNGTIDELKNNVLELIKEISSQ